MKPTAKEYIHRAGLRHRKGDHSGALADLNRAIDLAPSKASAYSPGAISSASEAIQMVLLTT